jgi:hypothetical protein
MSFDTYKKIYSLKIKRKRNKDPNKTHYPHGGGQGGEELAPAMAYWGHLEVGVYAKSPALMALSTASASGMPGECRPGMLSHRGCSMSALPSGFLHPAEAPSAGHVKSEYSELQF